MAYLITDCSAHGVTVTGDPVSAIHYQELAFDCQQESLFGSSHSHETGVSCWQCCDLMRIASGIEHA